jgi:hypothetical protein
MENSFRGRVFEWCLYENPARIENPAYSYWLLTAEDLLTIGRTFSKRAAGTSGCEDFQMTSQYVCSVQTLNIPLTGTGIRRS